MENNNRVTAVEWLVEQITYDNGYGQKWISFYEDTDLNIYFQQAKAMEKEQIIEAYNTGELHCVADPKTSLDYYQHYYGQ